MNALDVITGPAKRALDRADCLDWLAALPADSVDLVFGSPPYRDARTYGIDFKLKGQAWVDWMVAVYQACLRICKGLVAFVVEGNTKRFAYTAEPVLLAADLHRAGITLRKPPVFRRVGIPGSGGPDFLRNDYEFIVCATRGGKLPWSENTACGHPPRWAPGGAMSHRLSDGARVNKWGGSGKATFRKRDGTTERQSGEASQLGTLTRRATSGAANGDTVNGDGYKPPKLANPGNVITCKVGGGLMGSPLAHLNEAPFPEALSDFFVRSFCPPGGVVADPFVGSGTTGASALAWGRRFIGCDVRQSQVDLAERRLSTVTPMMFV